MKGFMFRWLQVGEQLKACLGYNCKGHECAFLRGNLLLLGDKRETQGTPTHYRFLDPFGEPDGSPCFEMNTLMPRDAFEAAS